MESDAVQGSDRIGAPTAELPRRVDRQVRKARTFHPPLGRKWNGQAPAPVRSCRILMNYSSTWLIGACNINIDLAETQRIKANRSVEGRSYRHGLDSPSRVTLLLYRLLFHCSVAFVELTAIKYSHADTESRCFTSKYAVPDRGFINSTGDPACLRQHDELPVLFVLHCQADGQ
jgi:hypothetical protein